MRFQPAAAEPIKQKQQKKSNKGGLQHGWGGAKSAARQN